MQRLKYRVVLDTLCELGKPCEVLPGYEGAICDITNPLLTLEVVARLQVLLIYPLRVIASCRVFVLGIT
jgi:hypothetical protein